VSTRLFGCLDVGAGLGSYTALPKIGHHAIPTNTKRVAERAKIYAIFGHCYGLRRPQEMSVCDLCQRGCLDVGAGLGSFTALPNPGHQAIPIKSSSCHWHGSLIEVDEMPPTPSNPCKEILSSVALSSM